MVQQPGNPQVSGTGTGERRLLGPQTTGRSYRNLSNPEFGIRSELDVAVPLRDGVRMRADCHRPAVTGRFPALIAVSPYPRQMQRLGIPAGFVEAGQTDFWVPRGYVHVIANSRGTGGSEGVYGFFDEQESRDLYDLIEWTAAQPWCDGNVGMLSTRGSWFRRPVFRMLNRLLESPRVHARFDQPPANTLSVFNRALRLSYDPVPWDRIYEQIAVEHQLYDAFWQAHDITDRIGEIRIPMYLGADWENVALHLNTPFLAMERLTLPPEQWRCGIVPRGGLQWPWESMHVEALAWYDCWLKGRDTGILEGPPIRYYMDEADEWRTANAWPPAETGWSDLWLGVDGTLAPQAGAEGARDYLFQPPSLRRPPNTNRPSLPSMLGWATRPFTRPVELAGPCVLHLEAASTAPDTDWIVKLQDVAPDGTAQDVTQGWLRASHRALDAARGRPYRPDHPHDRAEPLTPGEVTRFEMAVLPLARRFNPGHRPALLLTSWDGRGGFAMQGISHTPQGSPTRNSVRSSSRLTVPLIAGTL